MNPKNTFAEKYIYIYTYKSALILIIQTLYTVSLKWSVKYMNHSYSKIKQTKIYIFLVAFWQRRK